MSSSSYVNMTYAEGEETWQTGGEGEQIIAESILRAVNGHIHGWVSPPNYRGTWSILWTCVVTVLLCTYTSLCLNVPAPADRPLHIIRRRIFWVMLAILAPEVVLTYAAGQWSRARYSVAAFHESGYRGWTMRFAFFADMGGFALESPDCPNFPPNARQLHWLVVNGHVQYPQISPAEIWDRSKKDRVGKTIVVFQVGYLVSLCIGRLWQGFSVTAMEVNTLAIAACSLASAYAWLHKPSEVCRPIILSTARSMADMTGMRSWESTPLDFVDENGPGWATNIQPLVGLPTSFQRRPIQRIPDDRFPGKPWGAQEYLLCLAILIFSGFPLTAWNASFPTELEQTLWRACSLFLFCVAALFSCLRTAGSLLRLETWKRLYLRIVGPSRLRQLEKDIEDCVSVTQTEVGGEGRKIPSPWKLWMMAPVVLAYGAARMYLLVESLLQLRDLDASAFLNVDWSVYLPHI